MHSRRSAFVDPVYLIRTLTATSRTMCVLRALRVYRHFCDGLLLYRNNVTNNCSSTPWNGSVLHITAMQRQLSSCRVAAAVAVRQGAAARTAKTTGVYDAVPRLSQLQQYSNTAVVSYRIIFSEVLQHRACSYILVVMCYFVFMYSYMMVTSAQPLFVCWIESCSR